MRWIATVFLVLLLALPCGSAGADVRPDEITSRQLDGRLELHYPQRFAPAAAQIEETAPGSVRRIADSLGLEDLGDVDVWILPEVDDYFEVTKTPGRPPKWAIGLSLSDRGVIIVVNGAGPNGQLVDLKKTFEHELAHVAIDRARDGNPIPRWFNEGFALMQADEWTPDRADVFARAAATGTLRSFDDIERSFPAHSKSAGIAYSQSLQFVMHLEDIAGDDVYADILAQLRKRGEFDPAFKSAVGRSRALVEAQWRQDAEQQMSAWSVFKDGAWGFFGASILFVIAWGVRRKRAKSKLDAMEDDPVGWDYDESRYPLPGSSREM
jgi:hypothetical protein